MMKYFIITYGCQMNVSDSEKISAILKKSGHKPAKTAEQAGLIVINACSVRQSALHRAYAKINKFSSSEDGATFGRQNKKIILAGCVLESDKKKLRDKVNEFWHPDDYFFPPVGGKKQGSAKRDSYFYTCPDKKSFPRSSVSVPHKSAFSPHGSAFIPIMTGCNNFCSYCVVPFTRGREKSRPANEIIKEIKLLIENGCKEIMLLGQNVNSYAGIARESARQRKPSPASQTSQRRLSSATPINFPKLLNLINDIPGDFTIKFMTSHPKDISEGLINTIAECKKVSKEIHLPIQSGDNTILKKMNRKYTVANYKKLIKKIRAKIPNATISTDIIVGFPSETKKQFQNTAKLCKEIKFSIAYISKYSPRPNTAAHKLIDNVSIQEKKRRWKILDKLINKK